MKPVPSNNRIKSQAAAKAGQLMLVATPIGNLGDITLRALEALKSADLIACEDTRTTAKLLNHYGITTRTLAYHEHNEAAATHQLLEKLLAGSIIALVSDAGTPLLSDPGARLVAAAIDAGVNVTPFPGASALLAALTMAGMPSDQFYFAGFLPQKTKPRDALLASVKNLPATLVFYEAPHRLVETLEHLHQSLGDRQAAVARELTKLYEECRRHSMSGLIAHYSATPPKGECVILVHGAAAQAEMDDTAIDAALRDAMGRLSVKEAVAEVTAASGRSKSIIYARALELK